MVSEGFNGTKGYSYVFWPTEMTIKKDQNILLNPNIVLS